MAEHSTAVVHFDNEVFIWPIFFLQINFYEKNCFISIKIEEIDGKNKFLIIYLISRSAASV